MEFTVEVSLSLQEVVLMVHNGEYGRAISFLEHEVNDGTRPAAERLEYCKWLAECNKRMEDYGESGNWYIEAVRIILAVPADNGSKARQAMPLCEKALEAYEKGGDPADVLVASRLKQYLLGLSR